MISRFDEEKKKSPDYDEELQHTDTYINLSNYYY